MTGAPFQPDSNDRERRLRLNPGSVKPGGRLLLSGLS
jgi:hypothetical protein